MQRKIQGLVEAVLQSCALENFPLFILVLHWLCISKCKIHKDIGGASELKCYLFGHLIECIIFILYPVNWITKYMFRVILAYTIPVFVESSLLIQFV